MTPGPTTPSQPSPFGMGGAGSSARTHGSSPERASGASGIARAADGTVIDSERTAQSTTRPPKYPFVRSQNPKATTTPLRSDVTSGETVTFATLPGDLK